MTFRGLLSNAGRLFKLVVIGSVVATRSTSGAIAPDEGLEHELAWMAVRQGLAKQSDIELPTDVQRMVMDSAGDDLGYRVHASYRSVAPENIANLDAMWMDSLVQSGAGADATDQFLAERSRALTEAAASHADKAEKWRDIERIHKRTPYDAG